MTLELWITVTLLPELAVWRTRVEDACESFCAASLTLSSFVGPEKARLQGTGTQTHTHGHTHIHITAWSKSETERTGFLIFWGWDRCVLSVCQLNLSLFSTSPVATNVYCIHTKHKHTPAHIYTHTHTHAFPLDLVSGRTGSPEGHRRSGCPRVRFCGCLTRFPSFTLYKLHFMCNMRKKRDYTCCQCIVSPVCVWRNERERKTEREREDLNSGPYCESASLTLQIPSWLKP